MTWHIGDCYDDSLGRPNTDIVDEQGDWVASTLRQHAKLLRSAPQLREVCRIVKLYFSLSARRSEPLSSFAETIREAVEAALEDIDDLT